MAPRLSRQTSKFGVVSFVSKSLSEIEIQRKLKKSNDNFYPKVSEPCQYIDISNVHGQLWPKISWASKTFWTLKGNREWVQNSDLNENVCLVLLHYKILILLRLQIKLRWNLHVKDIQAFCIGFAFFADPSINQSINQSTSKPSERATERLIDR